jgi:hypothetical protein
MIPLLSIWLAALMTGAGAFTADVAAQPDGITTSRPSSPMLLSGFANCMTIGFGSAKGLQRKEHNHD